MREECTHFQSRTYASGEAARFCVLDLAPEAPWRCPENCPSYHRRLADVGWVHGSLVEPALEDEPGTGGPEVAAFLNSVEEIVNDVAPGCWPKFGLRTPARNAPNVAGGARGVET